MAAYWKNDRSILECTDSKTGNLRQLWRSPWSTLAHSTAVARGFPIGFLWLLISILPMNSANAQQRNSTYRLWLEPCIQTVVAASLKQYPLTSLAALPTRSLWSASLPSVEVSIQRWDDIEWRGTTNQNQDWSRRSDRDSRIEWRIKTQWDFSKLVHSRETMSAVNALTAAKKSAQKDIQAIIGIYYERRRLQLKFIQPEQSKTIQQMTWVRIQELTAQLNLLTNNIFQKQPVEWWKPIVDKSVTASETQTEHRKIPIPPKE